MMECDIQNPNHYTTIPDTSDIQKWVDEAMQSDQKQMSIVIRFVDKAEGKALNNSYRQKDYATNVLSFPYEIVDFDIPELQEALANEHQHIGDLVLCEPVVQKEAQNQNKTLQQHWVHLIIHGVLHLQGYDHLSDREAHQMESLEIKILEKLGFSNPYQSSYV